VDSRLAVRLRARLDRQHNFPELFAGRHAPEGGIRFREGKYLIHYGRNFMGSDKGHEARKIFRRTHRSAQHIDLPEKTFSEIEACGVTPRGSEEYDASARRGEIDQLGQALAAGAIHDHIKSPGWLLQCLRPINLTIIYPA